MTPRIAVPALLGSGVLVGLIVYSMYLLLQACALPAPFLKNISSCTTPAERTASLDLEAAIIDGQDLRQRIFQLERELATLQCVAALPDPTRPMSPEGWAERDLSMLYGCWDFDLTYRTRDVDTGEIRTYDQWQMCFDETGNGTQTMRSTDGIVCNGTVTARYSGSGLDLIEPGNLSCDQGGYIHQRKIFCTPAAGGRATCETVQPETNGEAVVGMSRAPT